MSLAGVAGGLTLTAPSVSIAQTGRPAGDVVAGPIDVKVFGAKGNRRDLDDEPFRKAIDAALSNDQYPRAVKIPAGHYRRANSIALPSHIAVRGEGMSSVINSQSDGAFDAPILINRSKDAAIDWRLADMSLFGGSYGVKIDVTREIANLRFDDVAIIMQSQANIEANKLFQTSKFFGGVLGSAPYGLKVVNPTTNALNCFGVEWTDHSKSSIFLRGASTVLIIGGRFEGGGQAGNATIDIDDGASITFFGVFFENVHEYLAKLRRVKVASFVNCHFTGTHAGSPAKIAPFKWDIDSNLLVFRDCHSSVPMPVPGNIVLDGHNANIFPANAVHEFRGLRGRISAAPRPLGSAGAIELLAAPGMPGGENGAGLYRCQLTLTVADAANAKSSSWQAEFDIVEQAGVGRLIMSSSLDANLGRVRLALESRADNHLVARYKRDPGAGGSFPELSWTIDWRRVAGGPVSSLMLYVPSPQA